MQANGSRMLLARIAQQGRVVPSCVTQLNVFYFHSTSKSQWVCEKPRNQVNRVTLTELRKATRRRKNFQPPAALQFDILLSKLGDDNDEVVRPDIRQAAKEVELALEAHETESNKSHTLYQLAKYVKRH